MCRDAVIQRDQRLRFRAARNLLKVLDFKKQVAAQNTLKKQCTIKISIIFHLTDIWFFLGSKTDYCSRKMLNIYL